MNYEDNEASFWDKVKENKWQWGLISLGVVLLVGGLLVFANSGGPQSSVEVISTDEMDKSSEEAGSKIVVDVAGAVESPGVYRLDEDARVDDALTAAGGMSEEADRVWVRRFVNLAQVVPDGAKIYIPMEGEDHTENTASSDMDGGLVMGISGEASSKVNVNTASKSELDSLWGIGEARAEAIINSRPYNSIEELMSRAGIPSNVFERNKEFWSVQ